MPHPPRFMHSIASLNMSLLKISSISFLVGLSRLQGWTFFVTLTFFPSTVSTCNYKKQSQWDFAKADNDYNIVSDDCTWRTFYMQCSLLHYGYLDLSILLSIHLNEGVLPRVRNKIRPIAPVVLCLVLKLFFKVLDSLFKIIKRVEFGLSIFPLDSD